MEINERVLKSAQNDAEFENLLREYHPFVAACASRIAGKYVDDHDDEMSIAIIAFSEAVKRFRPESGKFLNFAGHVIRSRIIDDMRAKGRTIETVSLDEITGEYDSEDGMNGIKDERSESFFSDPVRMEIDILSAELKKYGCSFMDIAKCSPKHEKTKKACIRVARCILDHLELLKQLKQTKLMPVKNIEIITSVPRKTIERHRNYIVCLVEILSGEYVYLAEYVNFVKEENKI